MKRLTPSDMIPIVKFHKGIKGKVLFCGKCYEEEILKNGYIVRLWCESSQKYRVVPPHNFFDSTVSEIKRAYTHYLPLASEVEDG